MLLRYQRSAALIGFTLLVYAFLGNAEAAIDETISELEGKTVVLPCPVNKDKCGELHSINWFKGDDRIAAMLLDDSNVTSVTAEFQNRVTVDQNPYRLVIKDLQISDEDIYLCDTTFFIPVETCDNFNGYRVELNVLVPPTEVVILDEKGDRIENGSVIGPLQERTSIKPSCIVRNTRPQPQVGWWREDKRLTTHSPTYDEKDGLYTATLDLDLQLSRDDLGQNIECRVESAALDEIITYEFSVDLQVRPTSITLNGVEHHTVQGSKVVLTCDVHGARPPVNLTWFNSTATIGPEENDLTEIRTKAFEKEDGTYHTQSELIFNATRFENDMIFRCDAENVVLTINREKPFTSSLTLEVLYPPVVKVSPTEITVNTSDTVLLNCEYVANPASLTHVVWYRNGDLVKVNDTDRYEGGNSENVALVIRSTDKEDIGNYTCQLANVIGKGVSEQQIELDVQYVPIVEVLMIPEGPVKESDESNVTLYCNILEANPAVLTKVRWYANSTLLKELPDCEETREDLCHIDPSKLLLESIGRGFFYNYSCEGYNAAGWGPRSEDKELMVHYEPGPATLTHFPLVAVKKKSVTFSCSVDDPGYPESNRFRWLRGGRGPLQDIVTKDWTVEPVGLDSRTNYSCYAFNEGGKGVMATVSLEVHAPPFFIKNLSPYTGTLHSARNANLTCRIECVPRCEISWLKDGVALEANDTRYFVKEKYMDASPATGDFESMLSVLHFNMSNWPNKKFDIEADNANYTCVSTGNTVGAGIKSATYFSIEYAPDNTTVSEEVVYVHEDTVPGRVICKSRANPEPTYEWRYDNKTVIRGNVLIINTPMTRNDSGLYTCLAFNKHGRSTADTFIDVQFKPRCEIERQQIKEKDTLICTAFGNPEEADFSWSIKGDNETDTENSQGKSEKVRKDQSHFILDQDYTIARTYRCVANNTAGAGAFCEIEVAEQLAWWQRWDKTTLIILIAAILALLLAVIIICCIIICICRRRRRQDKYHTDVSISATQSVLSYQPTTTMTTTTTTPLPQVGVALPAVKSDNTPQLVSATTLLAAQLCEPKLISSTLNNNNHNNNNNTTAASHTTTPTLTVKHSGAPNAPKSPPRWPLRPGVMVHVSSDTKENLAVNRMTLKPKSLLLSNLTAAHADNSTLSSTSGTMSSIFNLTATSTAQTSLNTTAQSATQTLGRRLSAQRMQNCERAEGGGAAHSACQTLPHRKATFLTAKVNPNNQIVTNREISTVERMTAAVASQNAEEEEARLTETAQAPALPGRNRGGAVLSALNAAQIQSSNMSPEPEAEPLKNTNRVENFFVRFFKRTQRDGADSTRDSQRSHVGLLGGVLKRGAFWKTARRDEFSTQHRLKGIRCSGSVTFKKAPPTASSTSGGHNNNGTPSASLALAEIINTTNTIAAAETSPTTTAAAAPVPAITTAHCGRSPPPPPPPPAIRLPASVTFQMPSLVKTTAEGEVEASSSPRGGAGGILKSPTPPPRPPPPFRAAPPPLLKRTVAAVAPSASRVERVQIHDKSSSLGDPLTEPGEYENLPFHGLQTAPNKFSTTPTNFNNNTNVVRVAPRPKRLNGNISQTQQQQQIYDQQPQLQYHQQQQQQQQQLQQQYSTMQYGRTNSNSNQQPGSTTATTTTTSQTMNSHNKSLHNMHDSGGLGPGGIIAAGHMMNGGATSNGSALTNPHQITYNLNNCFPKSYTEYYHQQHHHQQQQQQQQQKQQQQQQQQQQQHPKFASNSSASSAQLLNAIEHDYPAYAVVERNNSGGSAAHNTNPFLAASNFKKFDTDSGNGSTFTNGASQSSVLSTTGSMHRNKSSSSGGGGGGNKRFGGDKSADDKKFYSLKFTGGGKHKPPANKSTLLGLNASMIVGGSSSSSNKCKRHHSFAGGSPGDIDSPGPLLQHHHQQLNVNGNLIGVGNGNGGGVVFPPQLKTPMRFYDPPVYENLSDAVQVHECAVEAHPQPSSSAAAAAEAQLQLGATAVLLHPQPTCATMPHAGPTGPKKKHHHRQHQQKDDFNLIEPERLSIYRSDSGISNSSYECVTPVPPGGTLHSTAGGTPPPKTPKSLKSAKSAGLAAGFSHKKPHTRATPPTSTPVYMNVDGQAIAAMPPAAERSCSPTSTLVNSSYESASSSQNDGTGGACSTDPTSLSSCNSLYSSGTGTLLSSMAGGVKPSASTAARCARHHQPQKPAAAAAEVSTPEEYEQYQLGHHQATPHSASSLSVASNVSAASGRKCKKQRPALPTSGSNSGNEPTKPPTATNPFLASTNPTTSTTTTACNKKLRRQTISDPYAHIRYITHTHTDRLGLGSNYEAHNHSAKSANVATFQTATAAAAANNCSVKSHQQQISLQPKQQQQQQQQCVRRHAQQQMLMPHEQVLLPHCRLTQVDEKLRLPETARTIHTTESVTDMPTYKLSEQHVATTFASASASAAAAAAAAAGYVVRPIKLPLRKHHSFHFQPSQTVSGIRNCKLQQLRMQMLQPEQRQQQQQEQPSPRKHMPPVPPAKPPKRYVEEGPLVFRPLTLNENQAFKPISPVATLEQSVVNRAAAATVAPINSDVCMPHELGIPTQRTITHNTRLLETYQQPNYEFHVDGFPHSGDYRSSEAESVDDDVDDDDEEDAAETLDEEEDKSEMSEELAAEIKHITKVYRDNSESELRFNPAASLEALEALTITNPELIYASQPGSRQNLQTQLSNVESSPALLARLSAQLQDAPPARQTSQTAALKTALTNEQENDEDEDLGYSFCEDEDEHDEDEEEDDYDQSPNATVILSGSRAAGVGGGAGAGGNTGSAHQVKYVIKQSYREVHI